MRIIISCDSKIDNNVIEYPESSKTRIITSCHSKSDNSVSEAKYIYNIRIVRMAKINILLENLGVFKVTTFIRVIRIQGSVMSAGYSMNIV
jgi:hypothetical protein